MWQKYRADTAEQQADGALVWCAQWMGGPSLAKIENCRLVNLQGDMRRTVYVIGEHDTWFSIPAVCKIGGKRVTGYLTIEDDPRSSGRGNLVFRQTYY